MTLPIGAEAPDFTLKTKAPDGLNDVSLSSFRGNHNVVLLFFPFAFTGVCTEETCSVRDDLSSYEELDAQVLGISVDSPFAQEAMALKEGQLKRCELLLPDKLSPRMLAQCAKKRHTRQRQCCRRW